MANKLIILTDLGTLKAFKITKDEFSRNPRLELIEQIEPVDGHANISDKVTDQAGRFPVQNGLNTGQMSHGENHNLATEMERRVLKLLAATINAIVRREEPSQWFFAASTQIDQRILEQVEPELKEKMRKHVRSDLTKVDKSELLSYFE